jgi:LacI family transcriptional regulator
MIEDDAADEAHGGARRRASMREVADSLGVAVSSVSRVLSGHPDVSPAMRRRVLAAADRLDYQPDFLAQSLRRGATRSVGFIVGDISNPLLADITAGAEAALRAADYSMLLMDSENRPELDAGHVRFLLARRVDGLILSLASERDPGTLRQLGLVNVPIVAIDRDLDPSIRASVVLSDHATGMTAAVDHLVGLGHRRIALISGSFDIRPGRVRLEAVRATMARHGIVAGVVGAEESTDAIHAESKVSRILHLPEPPTAVIVGGNQLLPGSLRAIRASGLRVGRDVSLITCDEISLVEFHDPPLASVSRDNVAVGSAAAELLLGRLAGTPPQTVILPTTFIARASCAPPPAPRH